MVTISHRPLTLSHQKKIKLMFATDVIRCVNVLLFMTARTSTTVWLLPVFSAINSALSTAFYPAYTAYIAEVGLHAHARALVCVCVCVCLCVCL